MGFESSPIRHSRAGGNPARTNTPRSGQSQEVDSPREHSLYQLDSRLRGNDEMVL